MQVQGDPRLEPMSRNRVSIPGDFFHGMLKLAALVPPGYTSMFIWHHQQNPGSAPQIQGSPAGNPGAESQIQGSPAPDPDSTSHNPSSATAEDSSQLQSPQFFINLDANVQQNQGSPAPDPDSTLHNPSSETSEVGSQCKSPQGNSLTLSVSSISGGTADDNLSVRSFADSSVGSFAGLSGVSESSVMFDRAEADANHPNEKNQGGNLGLSIQDTWAQFWGCVQHFLTPLFPVARDQHVSGLGSHEGSFGGGGETTVRFCVESMNSSSGTEWLL